MSDQEPQQPTDGPGDDGYAPPVGFVNDGDSDAERHNAEVAAPVEKGAYVDDSPGSATELTSDTGAPRGGTATPEG